MAESFDTSAFPLSTFSANHRLEFSLSERARHGLLRALKPEQYLIDFCSNDYLGFANSVELKQLVKDNFNRNDDAKMGSTGSRLLTGNSDYAEGLECEIAQFHVAEAGLLFNSGYDANVGLFSCIAQRGDTIITDEFIHASIIDGVRLSYANRYTFKHNNLHSLEEKLRLSKGLVFVVVESVYSMDGDEAPLLEILNLTNRYGANLIVDEAHATGVFGLQGRGKVCLEKLEKDIFARIVTFGKALGCHGAIVLGSRTLRNYLINFSRSFIYTTASSFHNLVSVKCAYQLLAQTNSSQKLFHNISLFRSLCKNKFQRFLCVDSDSAIQCIIVSGNEATKKLSIYLQEQGFDVRPILSPTIPVGQERLRICLHSFNTDEEITSLIDQIKCYELDNLK